MLLLTTHGIVMWSALFFAWKTWSSWLYSGVKEDTFEPALPHEAKAKEKVLEAGGLAGEAIKEASQAIKEKAEEATQWTKEVSQDAAQWSKDAAQDAAQWTKEKTLDAAHWTREKANKAGDIFSRIRQRLTGVRSMEDSQSSGASPVNTSIRVLPDEYLLFVDAPGIPAGNLNVHVVRDQLLVYGSHEECVEKGNRRACWDRTVEEVFDLPADAAQEKIESWLNLQVLAIRIPRKSLGADRVIKVAQKGGGTLDRILEKVGLEDHHH